MRLLLAAFDLDGTLIDSERGIVRCMEQAVAALGLPPRAVAEWRDMIGLPLAVQLERLLPPERGREVGAAVDLYRSFWYALREEERGVPFPGVRELVAELAGRMPLAIATSKGRQGALATVAGLGWAGRFDPILTPEDVALPKPHPESLLRICAHHGVAPGAAVYVGDSRFDMEMAARAGVAAWGVTWGLHAADELRRAGATRCFADPAQLRDALLASGYVGTQLD